MVPDKIRETIEPAIAMVLAGIILRHDPRCAIVKEISKTKLHSIHEVRSQKILLTNSQYV